MPYKINKNQRKTNRKQYYREVAEKLAAEHTSLIKKKDAIQRDFYRDISIFIEDSSLKIIII